MSQDNHPRGGDTTEQRSGSGYSSRDGDPAEERDVSTLKILTQGVETQLRMVSLDTHPRGEGTVDQRGASGHSSRGGDTAKKRVA
jgi:hypothetical protein